MMATDWHSRFPLDLPLLRALYGQDHMPRQDTDARGDEGHAKAGHDDTRTLEELRPRAMFHQSPQAEEETDDDENDTCLMCGDQGNLERPFG